MSTLGYPIELLSFSDRAKFSLNEDAANILKKIPNDHKLVVVSIAGAFRKGKSFLLSFFLVFLNHAYGNGVSENVSDLEWLGDEDAPLNGFVWKCGQDRVTTGIQMWSKIFYATTPRIGKVAIIIFDTQGLFDDRTTTSANAKVFALSTMLSSIQILNLSQHVQEDNLQLLKFFTDYGSLAASTSGRTIETPFQKLLMLVRDWSYPHETAYGHAGGRKFVQKVLKISDKQHEELRSVRERIKSCFSSIEGFLMPYPGIKVATNPKFDGRLSDIGDEFQTSLKELVPLLFSPENLLPKRINGRELKITEFLTYLKYYVNKLNSDDIPTPKGIMEANAEVSHRLAFESAIQRYKNTLEDFCGDSRPFIPEDKLSKYEKKCKETAEKHYEEYPKFGANNSYREELKVEFDRIYRTFVSNNQKKKQIADLKQNSRENEKRMADLNESLKTMKNHHESSSQKVDDLNRKIDTLNTQISGLKLQVASQPTYVYSPPPQPSYSFPFSTCAPSPRRSSSSASTCSYSSSSSSNAGPFECNICGRVITSRIGMYAHKDWHARTGRRDTNL